MPQGWPDRVASCVIRGRDTQQDSGERVTGLAGGALWPRGLLHVGCGLLSSSARGAGPRSPGAAPQACTEGPLCAPVSHGARHLSVALAKLICSPVPAHGSFLSTASPECRLLPLPRTPSPASNSQQAFQAASKQDPPGCAAGRRHWLPSWTALSPPPTTVRPW